MERTLHLNVKLTGNAAAAGEKEVPFERVIGMSLKVAGSDDAETFNNAILVAVYAELGQVIEDAIDAAHPAW